MIKVSRLHGKEFYVNPDLIEFIEETPDLVISLISGKKVIVTGSAEELIQKIIEYRIRTGVPIPQKVTNGQVPPTEPGRLADYHSQLFQS
jgi:flagellar protein FlbD